MSVAYAHSPSVERPRQSAASPVRVADPVACFAVVCDAGDPGLLPRVLEPFAKLSLVPLAVHATRWSASELHIDLQYKGLTEMQKSHIAEVIRAMVGVEAVLTSEKFSAE